MSVSGGWYMAWQSGRGCAQEGPNSHTTCMGCIWHTKQVPHRRWQETLTLVTVVSLLLLLLLFVCLLFSAACWPLPCTPLPPRRRPAPCIVSREQAGPLELHRSPWFCTMPVPVDSRVPEDEKLADAVRGLSVAGASAPGVLSAARVVHDVTFDHPGLAGGGGCCR